MPRLSLALAVLALAACTPAPPSGASLSVAQKPSKAPLTREVSLTVLAPDALAQAGGGILNEDPSSLIAAGGLNLISNASTPLIAAGGLNYRLQAELDGVKPVEKAIVTFHQLTPQGAAISKLAAQTDAAGKVVLKAVAGDKPLEARAEFRLAGKTYRVSAAVPAGDLGGMTTFLDPINTIVTARIRAILKANGKADPALAFADLKAVWGAVNESGVKVDVAMLDSAKTLDELDAFYSSLVDQMTDEAKRKIVTDYMAKIRSGS